MKYIKTYENSKIKPNFKEGDYVICINSDDSCLTQNMRYLIRKIFKDEYGCYICKVKSKLGRVGETLGTFACHRFIGELEYDTKKYNI